MIDTRKNNQDPAKGKLLVSEPFLADYNFKRSVVLVTTHDETGTLGFILNKPLQLTLKDVMEVEEYVDVPLYLGGPVQNNTLHYIHSDDSLADSSQKIGEKLYWGGDFEQILAKLNANTLDKSKYRFFLGYSGWTAGQLEEEMDIHTWIVTSSSADIIFQDDDEELWKNVLRNMGGAYKVMSNSPESPQLN
ncbi:MAG: YqgE/AlgH family protein [Bacteroidia bacterium]